MKHLYFLILLLPGTELFLSGCTTSKAEADRDGASQELLNVSYDPTRELWKSINKQFIPDYKQKTGVNLEIKQSHGGSSSQGRSVIDGLEADWSRWPLGEIPTRSPKQV